MPLAWMAGVIGAAVAMGALVHFGVHGQIHAGALGSGIILGSVPFCVALIRLIRGHFDSALDES